jgi:hypothetical protein
MAVDAPSECPVQTIPYVGFAAAASMSTWSVDDKTACAASSIPWWTYPSWWSAPSFITHHSRAAPQKGKERTRLCRTALGTHPRARTHARTMNGTPCATQSVSASSAESVPRTYRTSAATTSRAHWQNTDSGARTHREDDRPRRVVQHNLGRARAPNGTRSQQHTTTARATRAMGMSHVPSDRARARRGPRLKRARPRLRRCSAAPAPSSCATLFRNQLRQDPPPHCHRRRVGRPTTRTIAVAVPAPHHHRSEFAWAAAAPAAYRDQPARPRAGPPRWHQ